MMRDEDKAWLDYRQKFAEIYDTANYQSPLQAFVMRASHRLTERAFDGSRHFNRVLEVGAGTGEHLPFVRHTFDEYLLTDMDAKTQPVAQNKLKTLLASVVFDKVRFEVQTGERLSYADNSFDRLIAVHVLEHIYQPHLALKDWYRVLKHGGVLSVLIPTDPGLAWRLGRHVGPRRHALAQGIAYDYLLAREHVNACNTLIAFLRHYFPGGREAWWPLPLPAMDVNLFFCFHATIDKSGEER